MVVMFSAVFVFVVVVSVVVVFPFALRDAAGKPGNVAKESFSVRMVRHAHFVRFCFDRSIGQDGNCNLVCHSSFFVEC